MKKLVVAAVTICCMFVLGQNINAQGHLLKRANQLFAEFDYQRAIEVYKKVLEKDKKNAEASENLAHSYRLTSNSRKAEISYRKAIRYNKDKNILKFYYGQALMSNKKYDKALEQFTTYTELSPKDSRGWRFVESCQNINTYLEDSSKYKMQFMDINSLQSDFGPTFYKNGIVFASSRFDNFYDRQNKSKWTGEAFVNMYFSEQTGGVFAKPKQLEGKESTPFHEGPATFNKGGTVMYFTRNVTSKKAKKSGIVNLKIFEARLLNGEWGDEKELPFNNNNYSVGHPSLSADGKTLYFASDMPGGVGGKDIYKSTWKHGRWTAPKNMGQNINTEGDEMFPFIHEDNVLYYASDGLGGFGGLDIFSATNDSYEWIVENIGYPINSHRDDFGLILTADKETGYFASNRKKRGGDDLYTLYIDKEKAAEMVAVVPLSAKEMGEKEEQELAQKTTTKASKGSKSGLEKATSKADKTSAKTTKKPRAGSAIVSKNVKTKKTPKAPKSVAKTKTNKKNKAKTVASVTKSSKKPPKSLIATKAEEKRQKSKAQKNKLASQTKARQKVIKETNNKPTVYDEPEFLEDKGEKVTTKEATKKTIAPASTKTVVPNANAIVQSPKKKAKATKKEAFKPKYDAVKTYPITDPVLLQQIARAKKELAKVPVIAADKTISPAPAPAPVYTNPVVEARPVVPTSKTVIPENAIFKGNISFEDTEKKEEEKETETTELDEAKEEIAAAPSTKTSKNTKKGIPANAIHTGSIIYETTVKALQNQGIDNTSFSPMPPALQPAATSQPSQADIDYVRGKIEEQKRKQAQKQQQKKQRINTVPVSNKPRKTTIRSVPMSSGGKSYREALNETSNEAYNDRSNKSKDIRLVLIGIVLDINTKEPINTARVELIDNITSEKQSFITEKDGNFYFKLESERDYNLEYISNRGTIIDSKPISTLNKANTQILHAILEGDPDVRSNNYVNKNSKRRGNRALGGSQPQFEKQRQDWEIIIPAKKADKIEYRPNDAYADPYEDTNLIFKIQIGSFKVSLKPDAGFFKNIEGAVDSEKDVKGNIRYMSGEFTDYKEAKNYKKLLIKKGYENSKEIAYLNGYRLDLPVEKVIQMYKDK